MTLSAVRSFSCLFVLGTIVLVLVTLVGEGVAGDGGVAGDADAGAGLAAMCSGCHGSDGVSFNPSWPSLAGQVPAQTLKQLQDYKNGTRTDPMMNGAVMALDDQGMADLAVYYGSMRAPPLPAPGPMDLGEDIYRWGREERGVVACGGCHGRTGAGFPSGIPGGIPSVAGQNVAYNVKTMLDYGSGTRANDWNGVMQEIAKKLSEEEIQAVSEYMSTLDMSSSRVK